MFVELRTFKFKKDYDELKAMLNLDGCSFGLLIIPSMYSLAIIDDQEQV